MNVIKFILGILVCGFLIFEVVMTVKDIVKFVRSKRGKQNEQENKNEVK